MSLRLSSKVCIITGTGGSVGRAAALTFAREGASVVGCDVNASGAEATVELVRAASGTMVSLQPCHLAKPTDCQALVDFAVRSFGRIDVLFNNAAMAPDRNQPDSRAAEGSGMGGLHARQDAVGSSRPPGGSGERGSVPGLRREFVCDRRRYRGRWRNEGLVIAKRRKEVEV